MIKDYNIVAIRSDGEVFNYRDSEFELIEVSLCRHAERTARNRCAERRNTCKTVRLIAPLLRGKKMRSSRHRTGSAVRRTHYQLDARYAA